INDQSVLFLPAEKGGKILYRNYLSDFLSSCYTDIRQIVAGKTDSLSQKRKIQKFFFRLSQRKRTQTFQINIIGHMINSIFRQYLFCIRLCKFRRKSAEDPADFPAHLLKSFAV